jgi:UTP--glucose-1-phosphate uridylyltransferase
VKKVRKAIIPAAGLGTRFLPATKAMPKEMLPIVDTPTIQFIVEEAVKSGIEDIIIVTGKGKRAIEDHFDKAFELEQRLLEAGKTDLLQKVNKSTDMVDIHYIRQKEPKGLGHAILCAKKFIGDEPFAVLLGDVIGENDEIPFLKQLINEYDHLQTSIVGVQPVPYEKTNRYGIIDPLTQEGRLYLLRSLIEKPKGNPPSNMALIGRYVFTPTLFDYIEQQETGVCGEIQLTDSIDKLISDESVYAYELEGMCHDVGDRLGFILTSLRFAINNHEIKKEVLDEMRNIIEKESF